MEEKISIYEDLKIVFLPSGYITEDECCGYDEIAFIVRKSWLQKWFEQNIKCEDIKDLNEWLENYYSENEAFNLYTDAKYNKEIILEKKIWNNRIHYYEVYEEVIDGLEKETTTFLRTMNLHNAIKLYKKEKELIKENQDFILTGFPIITNENFNTGEAELTCQDIENNRYYSLYLTEREIEQY